ncbi:hypothetical protein [Saccharothrix sp. NRRL B-16348]|nr:hypothetical protein [Saccharothrix sp. NRRL B-16348]
MTVPPVTVAHSSPFTTRFDTPALAHHGSAEPLLNAPLTSRS